MHRTRTALPLWAALLIMAAVPARTGTLDAAHIGETVFKSGLRLVVKEAHATDLAAVQVWIRAGGFREDERSNGTAHAIEHLLFKASEGRGSLLDDEIENLGGLLEATTEKDWIRFTVTVNGRYVGKVVSLVGETLRNPKFRKEDLEAEKPLIIQELRQINGNPEALVSRQLYEMAFRGHAYRFDVRGTPATVNSLDVEKVQAYYQKHFVAANMTVIVVGDVERAGVERAVRQAFQADQPAGAVDPLPADERACEKGARLVRSSPFPVGFVGIAFPAPSVRSEPDVYAMDVLLTLLELDGNGRLPRLLKGMPVQATFETRRQPGLFLVQVGTGRTDPEQVEALIRKEIDAAAAQPVSAAELANTKRALRGSYVLDNESYAGQAGSLGYYAVIDRWQFASEYLAKVEAVTAEQVQEVARKYLKPENSVAVVLKPRLPQQPPRTGT